MRILRSNSSFGSDGSGDMLPPLVMGLSGMVLEDKQTKVDATPPPLMLLEMEAPSSDSESEDNLSPPLTSPRLKTLTKAKTKASVPTVLPHISTCVKFAEVQVRTYAITIGDHPCCSLGCPVTLDWEYTSADATTVDQYETQRCERRRNRNELRTSPEERTELLLQNQQLSECEIRRASRKLHRARSCSARLNETFFSHCPSEDDE
jgi:hypothetical protein